MIDRIRIQELSRLLGCPVGVFNERLPVPLPLAAGYQHQRLRPEDVRHALASLGTPFDFKVLAFINLKGGVGKTTSSLALASRAAQLGFRTCLLDMDAQASATLALGGQVDDLEDVPVFQTLWQTPERVPDALRHVDPFLGYLPSSLENSLLDVSLMNPTAQKTAVMRVCSALRAAGYDLVILDCPPSLGGAVISSICASDVIVVPVACDAFSRRGLQLTIGEAEAIRDTFGLPAPQIRILPTMLDRRRTLTEPFLQSLSSQYGDKVLTEGVRTSSLFSRILEERIALFSRGVTRSAVHHDYDELTKALLLPAGAFAVGRRMGDAS